MTRKELFQSLWIPMTKREPHLDELAFVIIHVPQYPYPILENGSDLKRLLRMFYNADENMEGVMWMPFYSPKGTLEFYERVRLRDQRLIEANERKKALKKNCAKKLPGT